MFTIQKQPMSSLYKPQSQFPKTQILPNIIFITSKKFFQQVQTVSEADTQKNQRVTKDFKIKPANKNSTDM